MPQNPNDRSISSTTARGGLRRRFVLGAAGLLTLALCALVFQFLFLTRTLASEINTDKGIAIKGYDPVAYFTQKEALMGKAEFGARYKDATFLFTSAANRDAFQASPERFTPQYGGFCAYGTAQGYKADIHPQAFTIRQDRLYLNYSLQIQADWSKDIPGYVASADKNWPTVVKTTMVYR